MDRHREKIVHFCCGALIPTYGWAIDAMEKGGLSDGEIFFVARSWPPGKVEKACAMCSWSDDRIVRAAIDGDWEPTRIKELTVRWGWVGLTARTYAGRQDVTRALQGSPYLDVRLRAMRDDYGALHPATKSD